MKQLSVGHRWLRILSSIPATYARWGVSLIAGGSLAIIANDSFFNLSGRRLEERAAVWVILTLIGSVFAHRVFFGLIWPRLQVMNRRRRMIFAGYSLLIVGLLWIVLPVRISLPHTLEIVATGEKNPASSNSEVWVWQIGYPDGRRIDPSEMEQIGQWEIRDGILISYQDQPASLKWTGRASAGLKVIFGSHEYSGVALVRWDGVEQRLDLYNEGAVVSREVDLPAVSLSASPGIETVLSIAGLGAAYTITLFFLTLSLSVLLITRPDFSSQPMPVSRWEWIYYALPCAGIWTLYLLAFWPGVMSLDSIDQFGQAISGRFEDLHPAFLTMVMWALTRVRPSPAVVALAQIIGLSAVTGWGLVLIRRLGTPRWLAWVACAIFALSPVNGAMVVTIWKDIPNGIAMLALTLVALLVVESEGVWLHKPLNVILMGITILLTALSRQNAPAAAFGTPVILGIFYRKYYRAWLVVLLLGIGLWVGIRGPLYDQFDVQRQTWRGNTRNYYVAMWAIEQIQAHIAANTTLTDQERSYLQDIMPLEYMSHSYDLYYRDSDLLFGLRWAKIHSSLGQLYEVYLALLMRRPEINLKHLACRGSLLWEITQPESTQLHSTDIYLGPENAPAYIVPNDLGIEPSPKLPDLGLALTRLIEASRKGAWLSIIWRPALYFYILLAGLVVRAVRIGNWRAVLIGLPCILHTLLLVLINIEQGIRFQYPVYLVVLLLWPWLFFPDRHRDSVQPVPTAL